MMGMFQYRVKMLFALGVQTVTPFTHTSDGAFVNPYIYLVGAIMAEVIGTTALDLSEGFTNPLPSIGVLVGYGASFYLLSLTLDELSIGLVYATWTAVGVVAIAAIGLIFLGEEMDTAGAVGIGLIIAGVYVLNVVSNVSAQ